MGRRFRIVLDGGYERLRRRLHDAPNRAQRILGSGLKTQAERIMTVSKRDWVPVDKGPLRASGFVHEPQFRGRTKVEIRLSYGGAASSYALKQHEDTSLNHPTGGRAHYLSGPVREASGSLGKRVAATMKRDAGKGIF